MDGIDKSQFELQSQSLRADLKAWESQWAQDHEGKKPGRNDIKSNPEIAQKYKEYNKTRDILAGKISPPPKETSKVRKRKPAEAPPPTSESPSKRFKTAQTPVKTGVYSMPEDCTVTPMSRRLFSPQVPTSIGPTPQRDGKVLGLFDLLEEVEGTPCKTTNASVTINAGVHATPSKRTTPLPDPDSGIDLGRTPMSSGKRRMLGQYATPLKSRNGNAQLGSTPTSVSKLQFATPAFLKRNSHVPLDENGEFPAPAPIKLPRKPPMRGLSSIVASLRKLEEEQLDDELETLRELEAEESMPAKFKPALAAPPKDEVLVGDSQAPTNLLGGFDDEGRYDSPTEEGLDRDGKPLRVFKKKGQKRTTRRVNMRPARVKRPSTTAESPESGEEEDDTVPETQLDATKTGQERPGELSGSDFDGSDGEEKAEETKSKKLAPGKKADAKEGTIKKAVKKVNAMAHTNFKRLKLRNSGAKGGPGCNSRFRRRR